MRIATGGSQIVERLERAGVGQLCQAGLVPGHQIDIPGFQKSAEIRTREAVVVMQGAATHAVEENVGEVMHAGPALSALLERSGSGDAFFQGHHALRKVGGQFRGKGFWIGELVAQTTDCRVVQARVCNHMPVMRASGCEHHARRQKVCAEHAADLGFRDWLHSPAIGRHLPVAQ